jgi:hypothetical protein
VSTITSSSEEARRLIDVIDNWTEGLPSAEEATVQDRTIDSPEQLLELVAEYNEQAAMLANIRRRVVKELERHEYGN